MPTKKSAPKKTAKRAPAKKKAPAPKKGFTATLSLYGKNYIGTGIDTASALADIKLVRPPRARAVLTVSNGKQERDRILTPFQVQKLFSQSPLMREIALKQTTYLFDL